MSSIENVIARTVNDLLSIPSTSQRNGSRNIPTPMTSPVEYYSEPLQVSDDPLCHNCVLDNLAYSKCFNCNENLCDTCVGAHRRVRETKHHNIKKIHGLSQNSNNSEDSGVSGPSGLSMLSQSPSYSEDSVLSNNGSNSSSTVVPSSGYSQSTNKSLSSDITQLLSSVGLSPTQSPSSSYVTSSPFTKPPQSQCPRHNNLFRLFCKTCLVPVCNNCVTFDHQDHSLTYLEDGLDTALQTSARLTEETRRAMMTLRESLDNVQRMTERVERKAFTTASEVKNAMRKYISAFEARERDLLRRISQGRQVKLGLLNSQMENLRIAYSRIAKANDFLNECSKTVGPVTFDLLAANGQVHKELKEFRSLGISLSPCEDDGFHFLPPPDGFQTAINNLGRLTISSSALNMNNSNIPSNMGSNLPSNIGSNFGSNMGGNMGGLMGNNIGGNMNSNIGSNLMGRLREPQQPYVPSTGLGPEPDISTAIGRPVHGVPNPVVVKDMGPNPFLIFGTIGISNNGNKAGGGGEGQPIDGKVNRPWGVTVNRFGQYIVGDRSNHQIQVFDSKGQYLFKFGSNGSGPGQFNLPAGVAVNPQDDIVVADKDNHRIQVFKRDGTFNLKFGEYGSQIGQFAYPWDVACDSKGNIVVSDSRNHRIQLFTWNGTFIAKYGFEGKSGPPNMYRHFDQPRGVCFHPSGEIVVTDFNNHRLVIIDPNLTRARYLGEKSEQGEFGKFFRPQGVVCDDRGNIVVADARNSRVQIFNEKGDFLWAVGQFGARPGELNIPSGVCLTVEGRVAVIDFGNNRLQTF